MTLDLFNTYNYTGPKIDPDSREKVWVVLLAGGEGTRLQPFIKQWLGEDCPKQYCAFDEERTLLQKTIDRVKSAFPETNVVTVIGKDHRRHLAKNHIPLPGQVIEQPRNCGVAAGVYLAVSHILKADPEAKVAFFPCDHFVHPEENFLYHIHRMVGSALHKPNKIYLMGAIPTYPEPQYGWIEPSLIESYQWSLIRDVETGPINIRHFYEKPLEHYANQYYKKGYLWNTLIFAAGAQFIWDLGYKYLKDMMEPFETYRRVVHAAEKGCAPQEHLNIASEHLHHKLRNYDFSRDLLQPACQECKVFPLTCVDWSDWGTPERIFESFSKYGWYSEFLDGYMKYKFQSVPTQVNEGVSRMDTTQEKTSRV